jgi:hypothetical protein
MAHYAFLDENNIVIEVIVGKEENEGGVDWEQHYGNFRGKICKRTSYNTIGGVHLKGGIPFRKNYAGIGYTYNEEFDAFVPPSPFPSFILNEETADWVSPLGAAPELTEEEIASRSFYRWDEDAYQADNTTGWVLETP